MGSPRRIIDGISRGDAGIFREFYDQTAPRLMRFICFRVGGDAGLAEEILQEAFARLCANPGAVGKLPEDAMLAPWMFGMTRRIIADWVRSRAHGKVVSLEVLDPVVQEALLQSDEAEPSEAALAHPQLQALVGMVMSLLSPVHADALHAKYIEGLSVEEIEQLVDEAGRAGTLDPPTAEITARALAFRDLTAQDVMVPRARIVGLPRDASQDELRQRLLEEGRSRMPVYGETLDDVVGYVLAKDLAVMAYEKHLIVLADIVRPVHFVPASAKAANVLRELQRRRTQLAIVVDEHGGVAGMVTLEDLVEELVGEIVGEAEEPEPLLRREPGGTALVRGDAPIREVNRELGTELPEGEGYTTVAGLCISLAGAVPERGQKLKAPEGTEIEVVEATPRLVRLLRLRPPAPEAGPKGPPLTP